MDRMRERMPEAQVTAARVEAEYKENVKNMNTNSTASITANFVDVAMTVNKRMLSVPGIAKIIEEFEELAAQSPEMFNPFNSHMRLQAMVDKARKPSSLLWCIQALSIRCQEGLGSLSERDIKGSPASSNRGLFDLFMVKRQLRDTLVAKGLSLFDADGRNWIDNVVSKHVESFITWNAQEKNKDLTWRANRKQSEIMWLNLLIQVVFRQDYDSIIKTSQKHGESPEEMLQGGLSPAWQPIVDKRTAETSEEKEREKKSEESDENKGEENGSEKKGDEDQELPVQFVLPDSESSKGGAGKLVKLTELDEESQAIINTIVKDSRLQLRAQVVFVPQSLPKDDLRDELCRAPAAAQPTTGFVGIFYDPKLSGEPMYRPGLRTAGVRDDTYASLIKIILNRHSIQATEIGGARCVFCDGRWQAERPQRTAQALCRQRKVSEAGYDYQGRGQHHGAVWEGARRGDRPLG